MAKSKETFNKKSKEQKRLKQRQDKLQKMEERKQNAKKGKSLEEMMAYVDENGDISDTPPDPRAIRSIKAEDIAISIPAGNERSNVHTGRVQFFDEERNFGFILDDNQRDRVFFHGSNLAEPVKLHDKLQFETARGDRGLVALNIHKA